MSTVAVAILAGLAAAVVVLVFVLAAAMRERRALARQGKVISTAVRRLTTLHDPDEVIGAAVELAAELISPSLKGGRRALYFVIEGDAARVVAQVDEAGGAPAAPIALADHPALASVVETGQPVQTALAPATLGPSARRIATRSRVTHGAAVPITVDGRLHGVLAVGGRGRAIAEFPRLIDLGAVVELALANALVTQELAQQATTDPLTGCANRRGLQVAEQALPSRERFAVMAADLDGLKSINDRAGHDAGDAALRAFADAVRRLMRGGDVLARVGGDEFLLLLHDADVPGAVHLAQRVLKLLSAEGGALRVSLGIATGTSSTRFENAWHDADVALYRAKSLGGMRYEVAAPSEPPPHTLPGPRSPLEHKPLPST